MVMIGEKRKCALVVSKKKYIFAQNLHGIAMPQCGAF